MGKHSGLNYQNPKKEFNRGNLVVKANTKEGHRTFVAFQPKMFVEKLIGKNELQEHLPGIVKNGIPQQYVWIIKKL